MLMMLGWIKHHNEKTSLGIILKVTNQGICEWVWLDPRLPNCDEVV
jgi:hypothetical protein